jgi:predicted MFS family arabinose efflux permease
VATSIEAVILLVIPWPSNWVLTCVLTFVFGFANILAVVNVINFRQEETPEELQSRINTSGRMLSWGGGGPIGALMGGIVAHQTSPAVGVFFGACVLAVSTLLAWNSSLRSIPALRSQAAAGTIGAPAA